MITNWKMEPEDTHTEREREREGESVAIREREPTGKEFNTISVPVWHECILFASEHCTNIGGVFARRIEVSVVSDLSWQVHGDSGHGDKTSGVQNMEIL